MLTAVRRRQSDEGFTLVEVLVALTLFAVVAAAIVPLLAVAGSAAVSTRSHTRAKNLSQERVEQMRQLPFQVDIQNGPFRDLLDYYYPNLNPATSSTTTGWVPTGGARVAGEPTTGSFYRTRFATLPGQPGFSQTVAVQFLNFSRTPLPDTQFVGYTNATAGLDDSPSTLLGVTVLTYWKHAGRDQSFRTFTQIGDTGDPDGLLIAQASSTLLRLESAVADSSSITSELLSILADGRLSDGSVASSRATAGRATRAGTPDLVSANAVAVDPPNCQGSSCPTNNPASGPVPGTGTCGYASFGRTKVENVTATTLDGRPRVPADVDAYADPTKTTSASLLKETGHSCGALTFDNTDGVGSASLLLAAGSPVVTVGGDSTSSGSTPIATSNAWVNTSAADPSTGRVASGAKTGGVQSVRLFPTTYAPEGLLKLQLVSAQLTCDSSSAAPVGSYTVRAQYWNADRAEAGAPAPAYVDLVTGSTTTTDILWSSTSSSFVDPFVGMALGTKVVYKDATQVKTLADFLESPPRLATAVTADSTNGLASIGDAVLSLTTQPIRAGDPLSSIGLKMGKLSCVAVDQR